jgi:hypothetical protein
MRGVKTPGAAAGLGMLKGQLFRPRQGSCRRGNPTQAEAWYVFSALLPIVLVVVLDFCGRGKSVGTPTRFAGVEQAMVSTGQFA